MGFQNNVLLKNHTTFRIGGKTRYFFIAKNKNGLISAVKMAKKNKLPFFVLGGGSNLLVSDKGYKGLVVKIQMTKSKCQMSSKNQYYEIFSEAGVSLNQLVNTALKNNLTGIEWAVGIPGTVGGAVYGNAGAFGKSMKNIIKEVETLDFKTLRIKKFKNKDCKFSYRDSIFKKNKNLIILSIEIQLKISNKKEIQKRIKKYFDYKKTNQPLNFYSAGSVFLNSKNFTAGELIEKCGLKGKKIGNIKISEKHANFIVNLGDGKAKDIKKLINLIKKEVKNKFNLRLEEEIQYLGF